MKKTKTPVQPITQTLSESATTAVLEMRLASGREVEDIINGILVAEIKNAMGYAGNRQDDGWNITAEQIEDAARERLERTEVALGQIQETTRDLSCRITIDLTPGQLGALQYLTEHDGYACVKDCLLGGAAGWLGALGDNTDELRRWFRTGKFEE